MPGDATLCEMRPIVKSFESPPPPDEPPPAACDDEESLFASSAVLVHAARLTTTTIPAQPAAIRRTSPNFRIRASPLVECGLRHRRRRTRTLPRSRLRCQHQFFPGQHVLACGAAEGPCGEPARPP